MERSVTFNPIDLYRHNFYVLIHWGRDKIADIIQMFLSWYSVENIPVSWGVLLLFKVWSSFCMNIRCSNDVWQCVDTHSSFKTMHEQESITSIRLWRKYHTALNVEKKSTSIQTFPSLHFTQYQDYRNILLLLHGRESMMHIRWGKLIFRCRKPNNFESKTLIRVWTYEKYPYFIHMDELRVSFVGYLGRRDRHVSKAHWIKIKWLFSWRQMVWNYRISTLVV